MYHRLQEQRNCYHHPFPEIRTEFIQRIFFNEGYTHRFRVIAWPAGRMTDFS